MAAVASIRAPNSLPEPFWDEILEDEIPEVAPTQAISGRNINPTKLISLLRTKFGAGAYDIHMMHNEYCIMAPRKLSLSEIAECRRR